MQKKKIGLERCQTSTFYYSRLQISRGYKTKSAKMWTSGKDWRVAEVQIVLAGFVLADENWSREGTSSSALINWVKLTSVKTYHVFTGPTKNHRKTRFVFTQLLTKQTYDVFEKGAKMIFDDQLRSKVILFKPISGSGAGSIPQGFVSTIPCSCAMEPPLPLQKQFVAIEGSVAV